MADLIKYLYKSYKKFKTLICNKKMYRWIKTIIKIINQINKLLQMDHKKIINKTHVNMNKNKKLKKNKKKKLKKANIIEMV